MTQYVFDSRQALRYRFPTHTNDLIMDRRDATASEAFFVVLAPGEAPPLHVHNGVEQVFYILEGEGLLTIGRDDPQTFPVRVGDSSERHPRSLTPSAAPGASGSCTSASIASLRANRPPSRPGTATSG